MTHTPISHVILASKSPRRVALLADMGVQCTVMPADIDESVLPGELPVDYVLRLAIAKAQAVAKRAQQDLPILAADTTVAYKTQIFGKPESHEEAFTMLRQLSGQVHWVHTAVALVVNGMVSHRLSSTEVHMMTIPEQVIADYVASGEPMDKAGAYGIQGRAGRWITQMTGSYSGVMGLPLHETAELLRSW